VAVGRRISDKVLLGLIEHIYTAGCDPQEWPVVAERMQAVFPGCSFSLVAEIGGRIAPFTVAHGISPDFLKSYVEHYHTINPYEKVLGSVPTGEVSTVRETVRRDWLDEQPFYHEWLKPAGDFTAGANITYFRTPEFYARTCFDIPSRLARLERPAAILLERLEPHMSRALMLTAKSCCETLTQASLDAMLARLSWAACVVDDRCRILMANAAAENLLAACKLVKQLPDGRLAFHDTAAAEAFEQALRCLAPCPDEPVTSFAARAANGSRCPVFVFPLGGRGSGASYPARQALVVMGAGARRPRPADSLLRDLYGLTPAEAALVQRLAAGGALREAADASGISLTTARNQLAAAMAKMGVNRQSELVVLMAKLVPGLDTA
jgi:DNA-binding CsgD family transcriptional regulator